MAVAGFASSAEEVMRLVDYNPKADPDVMVQFGSDIEIVQEAKLHWIEALEGPAARLL